MPVVRNPQFYFKEGFTYPLLGYFKVRLKEKTINDVSVIGISTISNLISNLYVISTLNSQFIFDYLKTFINSSVNNSLTPRLLPIIIPTKEQLEQFENIAKQFIQIKKDEFSGVSSDDSINLSDKLQKQLDEIVIDMYLK